MKETNINYVTLFFWLYKRTKLNNECLTSANELKNEFINEFPSYNINETNYYINSKIGICLNLIYGSDVARINNKRRIFYNIELLPETPQSKAILINGNKWGGGGNEYL